MISQRALRTAFLLSLVLGMCPRAFGQEFQLQPKPKGFIQLEFGAPGTKKPAINPVEVKLSPVQGTASELQPGDEVRLSITVNVPPGSHAYSMTTPKGGKTGFEISKLEGLEPASDEFSAEREPHTEFSPFFDGIVEEYHEPITWTRLYRLIDAAQISDVLIEGTVHAQVCDDSSCRELNEPFFVSLEVKGAANAIMQKERPKLLGKKPGPAELTATLAPQNAKPGEKVKLTIEMALDEGWHTFSITQKKVSGAKVTEILIEKLHNLKPLGEGFDPSEPFERKIEDLGFEVVEHELHHGKISWSREYEVLPAAEAAGFGIKGALDYQTCKTGCVPGGFSFDLQSPAMRIASRSIAPSQSPAAVSQSQDAPSKGSREARLDVLLGKAQAGTAEAPNPVKSEGLLLFIATAIGAGFLALLTPCVYPMVPITISFFLKQAEKQHHRPVTLALVYCGGIIATFTGLGLLISGLFEATDLNLLANSVWLNIMLTVVIAFFGLSMLGLFEIHVPSWLLTWSARKEGSGGIVGTLFMALTFTLVSFTCTFAFAGALLVMASKGEVFWPVVGMLAFSAAFAFPFFLLALFPQFLTKLPKSGGWMNIVKVSMGFLEIGAALKFLSTADASLFGQPTYLPYGVVMGAWFVLAVLTGLYPLGLFRLPHDMPGKFTFGRLAFAAPFLALAVLLGVRLFTSYQPTDWVSENIAAFAPPRIVGGKDDGLKTDEDKKVFSPYLDHDELEYALDFFQALDYAREQNLPLFVDFTGINCVNCRKMEQQVLPLPQNRERLEKFVRVQLFTDTIPIVDDAKERESLLNLNRELQKAFGDVVLPGYVVLNPHDLAENGRLKPLSSYIGMEQKSGEFARFLDQGLEKWQAQSGDKSLQSANSQRKDSGSANLKLAAQQ